MNFRPAVIARKLVTDFFQEPSRSISEVNNAHFFRVFPPMCLALLESLFWPSVSARIPDASHASLIRRNTACSCATADSTEGTRCHDTGQVFHNSSARFARTDHHGHGNSLRPDSTTMKYPPCQLHIRRFEMSPQRPFIHLSLFFRV